MYTSYNNFVNQIDAMRICAVLLQHYILVDHKYIYILHFIFSNRTLFYVFHLKKASDLARYIFSE